MQEDLFGLNLWCFFQRGWRTNINGIDKSDLESNWELKTFQFVSDITCDSFLLDCVAFEVFVNLNLDGGNIFRDFDDVGEEGVVLALAWLLCLI